MCFSTFWSSRLSSPFQQYWLLPFSEIDLPLLQGNWFHFSPAAVVLRPSMAQSLPALVKNCNYLVLAASFTFFWSSALVLGVVLSQVTSKFGYKSVRYDKHRAITQSWEPHLFCSEWLELFFTQRSWTRVKTSNERFQSSLWLALCVKKELAGSTTPRF